MGEFRGVKHNSEYRCDTFGGCPECGQSTGFTHSGRKRWIFCDTHKTKWCGGEVLSCFWRIEVTEECALYEAEVNSYREVEPLAPAYPVAIKVELEMSDKELAQHLRELADVIENRSEQQFRRMMGEGTTTAVPDAAGLGLLA